MLETICLKTNCGPQIEIQRKMVYQDVLLAVILNLDLGFIFSARFPLIL